MKKKIINQQKNYFITRRFMNNCSYVYLTKEGPQKFYKTKHHFVLDIQNPPEDGVIRTFYDTKHHFILNIPSKEIPSGIKLGSSEVVPFQNLVIKKVGEGESLTTQDITGAIFRSENYFSHQGELRVNDFTKQGIELFENVPLKEYYIEKHEGLDLFMDVKPPVDLPKASLSEVTGSPEFLEGVQGVCGTLDLKNVNLLECLELISKFAQVSEMLTFLAANPFLLKCLGVNAFIFLHSSLCIEGSFKVFISQIIDCTRSKISPFYRSIKYSSMFLYKNKFTVIGTTGTLISSFFFYLHFQQAKAIKDSTELLKRVTFPVTSNFAPENETVIYYFEILKRSICEKVFMASNLITSAAMAARSGSFYALTTPASREVIGNTVVPALIDKLGSQIKK